MKRNGIGAFIGTPDSTIRASDRLTSQQGNADMPLASQYFPHVLFLLPFAVDPTPDSQGRQG